MKTTALTLLLCTAHPCAPGDQTPPIRLTDIELEFPTESKTQPETEDGKIIVPSQPGATTSDRFFVTHECQICLENIDRCKDNEFLECGHNFHSACANQHYMTIHKKNQIPEKLDNPDPIRCPVCNAHYIRIRPEGKNKKNLKEVFSPKKKKKKAKPPRSQRSYRAKK